MDKGLVGLGRLEGMWVEFTQSLEGVMPQLLYIVIEISCSPSEVIQVIPIDTLSIASERMLSVGVDIAALVSEYEATHDGKA
jgi:hypothetical protein